MASNQYRQAPSAPTNSEFDDYPPPKVPARMDQQSTEQPLLPRRMDLPESKTTTSTHQVMINSNIPETNENYCNQIIEWEEVYIYTFT